MRVLHVYKDYYPVLGGIENHIKMLAEAQAAQGLDVTVLVTNPGRKTVIEEMNGVKVIKAGRLAAISSTPVSPGLFSWMRRLKVSIVHLHFPHPPGEVANLLFRPGQRTVITYHSDIVRQRWLLRFYRPFLWRVLASADRIIATSPQYIRSSPYLRRISDKCVVIPLGIDAERFESADPASVEAIRKRYGSPLLLFVGLLRYYKGLEYLLEAMREIEACLLIIGSGPMERQWRNLAERLGLGEKVAFLGEVPDENLPACYHACEVFILPASARSEAFGLVQLEAMAAGKPVVCTEIGTGTTYINLHGETGLVVPPRDPKALGQAINELLAEEDLRRRMGEKGRKRVRENFSKEVMVESILGLYQELLDAEKR